MQVRVCDVCHNREQEAESLEFVVGYEPDLAGDKPQPEVVYFDLCLDCRCAVYEEVLHKLYRARAAEQGRIVVEAIRKMMNEHYERREACR